KIIATASAPSAIGPYSQATSINGMVYTSGQLGIDPATGNFATQDIAGQTLQSLKNVKSVLEEAGSSMDKVLKTTVFLSDMNNFAAMNAVYAEFFTEGSFPSRSAVEVARLPKDGLVEIEAIATV
ncbi:MAG: RidA family protein, partial [Angelakisella sp.]